MNYPNYGSEPDYDYSPKGPWRLYWKGHHEFQGKFYKMDVKETELGNCWYRYEGYISRIDGKKCTLKDIEYLKATYSVGQHTALTMESAGFIRVEGASDSGG